MSENNRVFITGLGALTASGQTADATWAAVMAGESGIAEIGQDNISSWPCRLGGELKNFQAAKMLPDRKLIKVISKQDAMGINVAMQAVNHSGMIAYRDALANAEQFNDETAVFAGSPGNKYFQQYDFLPLVAKSGGDMQAFADQLFSEVHPMWLLRILPNNVLAYTGITYGFKGPNHNIANHVIGGAQALLEAFHAIKSGQAARAVVVAYDIGLEAQALYYYEKLGVLSHQHLKPFDKLHDGTLLAEGAAAIVLESEASALERQAVRYGEIIGGSSSTEAAGLFSIEEDGQPLVRSLQTALDNCGLQASDIGCIVAHANGNPKSDTSEAAAIRQLFSSDTPVSGFKWSVGHTLCASGLIDAVLTSYALKHQQMPGIANLDKPSEDCEHLAISACSQSLSGKPPYAMLINRGFASMNACIVVKACD